MDLNQLYHDHQLSLMRASRAFDSRVRLAQEKRAITIARAIETKQRALGAAAAHRWEAPYASANRMA